MQEGAINHHITPFVRCRYRQHLPRELSQEAVAKLLGPQVLGLTADKEDRLGLESILESGIFVIFDKL